MSTDNSLKLIELRDDIRDFCRSHADSNVVAKYAKYFREGEGYDPYGVPREDMAAKVKSILADHRESLKLGGFLDLGDLLLENGKYEEAGFAVLLTAAFKTSFDRRVFEHAGSWFEGKVPNWAVSDGVCGDILSPLLSQGIVSLWDFAAWRESPNRWKRRAVPVSMLALLKPPAAREASSRVTAADETTAPMLSVADLLDFIRPLMLDDERVVHQGLGWFLREAWKKHPVPVEAFLLEYKEVAARLIFQYATEKMAPEQKERFRRARKKPL